MFRQILLVHFLSGTQKEGRLRHHEAIFKEDRANIVESE
jgi:hypothetical protein